jgi:hypothetical protein
MVGDLYLCKLCCVFILDCTLPRFTLLIEKEKKGVAHYTVKDSKKEDDPGTIMFTT